MNQRKRGLASEIESRVKKLGIKGENKDLLVESTVKRIEAERRGEKANGERKR